MSVSLPPRDEGLPQVPSVLPIRSRRARLEPVNTKTTELLYQASIHEEIPWQWRGRVESPEGFRESLWAGVLCQSVIVSSTSDEIGGLVQAYAANLSHGYCYIQLLLLPHARLKVWPLEGALLFVNRIFEKYGFRKLYIETAAHRPADRGDQGAGHRAVDRPGKSRLGLTGPLPARVPADVKELVSPMHHWTDHKIRVHVFYCVLALAVARLMQRETERAGIAMSVRELLARLNGIQETVLLYQGERGRPRARRMLTEMDPTQARLYDLFDLDAHAPTR